MIVRVIIQTNRETGEQSVTFTGDLEAALDDFLIKSSKEWEEATVQQGKIGLVGSSDLIDALLGKELFSESANKPRPNRSTTDVVHRQVE